MQNHDSCLLSFSCQFVQGCYSFVDILVQCIRYTGNIWYVYPTQAIFVSIIHREIPPENEYPCAYIFLP